MSFDLFPTIGPNRAVQIRRTSVECHVRTRATILSGPACTLGGWFGFGLQLANRTTIAINMNMLNLLCVILLPPLETVQYMSRRAHTSLCFDR